MTDDPHGLRMSGCNPNHYEFVRCTGLARSDFRREWRVDLIVFWSCMACLALGALIVWGTA